eukprot:3362999-Rhodomonas_salina.1
MPLIRQRRGQTLWRVMCSESQSSCASSVSPSPRHSTCTAARASEPHTSKGPEAGARAAHRAGDSTAPQGLSAARAW